MENYLLFTLIATVTILSPGPGVLLTLTNSIRYGFFGAIGGIVGIAFGTFIVAGLSVATGALTSPLVICSTRRELQYVSSWKLI